MSYHELACARCATWNSPSNRFCLVCALPLGTAKPDADAASEALGPYEPPDPHDPDHSRGIRLLAERSGYEASPSGHGWRVVVPLPLDRRQAVYLGRGGVDHTGRAILELVSVCGPADDRAARRLLLLNARSVDGHFAIKSLRGEEYFVVIHNVDSELVEHLDAGKLIRSIAEAADRLEDRLTRGLDLY